MKNYLYLITFYSGVECEIYALCAEDAIILAKAEQIRNGCPYIVKDIEKVEE